jgi:hypothetical protein
MGHEMTASVETVYRIDFDLKMINPATSVTI